MPEHVLQEIEDRFGEYIEMAGTNSPILIINILARMLLIEREKNEYLEKVAYGRR
jgi:hypothetical protein